jgi:hypothetical protein
VHPTDNTWVSRLDANVPPSEADADGEARCDLNNRRRGLVSSSAMSAIVAANGRRNATETGFRHAVGFQGLPGEGGAAGALVWEVFRRRIC